MDPTKLKDPLLLGKLLWPDVEFYDQQRAIVRSVLENDETFVVACNASGKDFVTAFIVLTFFLTRHPCRVVTSSVDASQLEGVLWGEIRRFIQTSRYPLEVERGGPLIINHLHLRKQYPGKPACGLSYVIGRVAAKGEGFLGHHIPDHGDGVPRTLMVGDEASGLDNAAHERPDTWAKSKLYIGNAYSTNNFFQDCCEKGDVRLPSGKLFRKVIRIRAEDTPNVRLGLLQEKRGLKADGRTILPGPLSWYEYKKRRATWPPQRQTVGLDAEFYRGAGLLMFPPHWIDAAEERARKLIAKRVGRAMGVDPAEGGDDTAIAVVDEYGLIHLEAAKTANTARIRGIVLATAIKFGVPMNRIVFDTGGGGRQIADTLREEGYPVRTVSFGGAPNLELRHGLRPMQERRVNRDDKGAFASMRDQMYGELREMLDPDMGGTFAIPEEYRELRRQLTLMPLIYDQYGRIKMLPKRKPVLNIDKLEGEKDLTTLQGLLGCSPDESDALVLAVHGMRHKAAVKVASAAGF